MNLFLKDLSKVREKWAKQYRLFDQFGAMMDFETSLNKKMLELQRAPNKEAVNANLDFGDLDIYANTDRFKYVGKKEQVLVRLVAGIKQDVVTGFRYMFKTVERGNGLTIVVDSKDVDDYEDWLLGVYPGIDVKDNTRIVKKVIPRTIEESEEEPETVIVPVETNDVDSVIKNSQL